MLPLCLDFRKHGKICLVMATDSTGDTETRPGEDEASSGLMSSLGSRCHQ